MIRKLLESLDAKSVPHVYWKARAGLKAALTSSGKDYDLLVQVDREERVVSILTELGWKQFPNDNNGPGMSTWAIPEPEHRRLAHVHLHTQTLSGWGGIYEYHLPWERHMLETRDRSHGGIWTLAPSVELASMIIRATLEPKYWEDRPFALSAYWLRRFREHIAFDDFTSVASEIKKLLPALPEASVEQLMRAVRSPNQELDWVLDVREAASPYIRIPEKVFQTKTTEMRWRSRFGQIVPLSPRGARSMEGRFVALVGADGSGKSTLANELCMTYGSLVPTRKFYLGRGDLVSDLWGGLARATAPLRNRKRLEDATVSQTSPKTTQSQSQGGPNWKQYLDASSFVALALRKVRTLTKIAFFRQLGFLCISDRFPHPESRFADGPQISKRIASLRRTPASRLEEKIYNAAQAVQPDLVLILSVDAEVAHDRKPDHDLETIQAKVRAIDALTYPATTVKRIDANQPPEDVYEQAVQEIWDIL